MAEAVMRRLTAEAGLEEHIAVDSAGTGSWHVGERADRRARRVLANAGYPAEDHRARQFDPGWFSGKDLVIALDGGHLQTLRAWAPTEADRAKVHLLRSYDSGPAGGDLDVPDPYHEGTARFAEVLDLVESACRGLLVHVRSDLRAVRPDPAS